MKQLFYVLTFLAALPFAVQAGTLASVAGYNVVDSIAVGGAPKWDLCAIDPSTRRLFVSHGTRVAVIDLARKTLLKEFEGFRGTHAIAFAPAAGRGFITDGGDNSVTIFDLSSLDVKGKVAVGQKPDAIMFDAITQKIFCVNVDSKNVTVIDPATGIVVATVALQGQPECGVSDGAGKMYVNLEDESAVNVIDVKTLGVTAKWPLAPCQGPTGIAIDRAHDRIFSGGRNKLLAVLNGSTGAVIATLPIGAGVDACAYDPELHLVFASNKDGTVTVIEEQTPDSYRVLENVLTRTGSKTMALDESDHRIYVPANSSPDPSDKTKGALTILVLEHK